MQCLKCGREIPVGQVFCPDCLADMEKYPVKSGTPIRIPKRQEPAPVKKQPYRRPPAAPEVQVKRLKLRLWIVSLMLIAVLAASAAVAWMARDYILQLKDAPLPGQNYSSITDAEPKGPNGP